MDFLNKKLSSKIKDKEKLNKKIIKSTIDKDWKHR